MKNQHHNYRYLLVAVALSCAFTTAQARDLYRIIESDGTITYTDSPKPGSNATLIDAFTGASKEGASEIDLSLLPTKVRNAYTAYPVILYTAQDCPGCSEAKLYLLNRGIPYIEYTITTAQDAAEFKKQTGTSGFPTVQVGSKVLPGFNSKDWATYLSAAGFPETNELPKLYTNPSPKPLTNPADVPTKKPIEIIITPARSTQSGDTPNPNNPAGIRF